MINPQWLRNIKSKKYPIWRLDIIFSKKKYSNLGFVEDGGWHFTNVKSLEQIDYKMKNYLHHLEYEESGLKTEDLKKIITEKKALYDLNKDSKDFFNIPVSMIVKRRSNNQPVDHLTIENIAMNKLGTEIWLECYVEDEQMIEKEPKVKAHLDDSQSKFKKLADQMDDKIAKKNND